MTRKQLSTLLFIVLGSCILYSLISIVNHLMFRTYSLDLGLYTHALYQYSQFKMAGSTMIKSFFEPMPGSHFDLYLMLFSPLIHLTGSYTLIIVQILAILGGGIGVYQFLNFKYPGQRWLAIAGMLYFYTFFGVFSAVTVNYHSVAVAASALPWFLLAIHQHRIWLSVILWLFMVIAQENIALWLTFVSFALLMIHQRDRTLQKLLIVLTLLSAFYFVVVIQFIIPSFAAEGRYTGLAYSILGDSLPEALMTMLRHPWRTLQWMFLNHSGNPDADYLKTEFYAFLVISGLWLLVRKPLYFIMLVPLIFQKMLHDNPWIWSVGGQYSIEFAPVLAIGTFSILAEIQTTRLRRVLLVILLAGNLAITFRLMDNTMVYYDKSHIRFYSSKHYKRHYNVKEVHAQLRQIPRDARVSAQSPFVPHLVLRDHIYQFPLILDAEFIVLSDMESPWPLNAQEFEQIKYLLIADPKWQIFSQSEGVVIFRKQQSLLAGKSAKELPGEIT